MDTKLALFGQKDSQLRVIHMPPDGSCLFHSICYSVYGNNLYSDQVKEKIINYVSTNWTKFKILAHDVKGDNYISPEYYPREMLKPSTFGSACQLIAASKLFHCVFRVYHDGHLLQSFGVEGTASEYHILFSGNLSNGHFDVLEATHKTENNHNSLIKSSLVIVSEELEARRREASEPWDLERLLLDILRREVLRSYSTSEAVDNVKINCIAILADPQHILSLHSLMFNNLRFLFIPVLIVVVREAEDLLAPNYHTVRVMEQVRRDNCNLYIILLANGKQAARLLRFGDKYRLIDTRARFIMSHDDHLFEPSMLYLWNKIINVVFIQRLPDSSDYELSTVPFPAQINETIKLLKINTWQTGRFRKTKVTHFPEKTRNLKNHQISVVTFPHIPATVKRSISNEYAEEEFYYTGLEIEIMKSMSKAMNFQPRLYEVGENEEWGKRQLNGSYSGLLGELMSGRAQIALGNLQHMLYSLKLVDLSRPYMAQCLTFLTPASRTDNKWKTLVLPFLLTVWIAIILTLFLGGFIFFSLARYHRHLEQVYHNHKTKLKKSWLKKLNFGIFPYKKHKATVLNVDEEKGFKNRPLMNNYIPEKAQGLFIFEELQNSVLYTYGMLVSVSLPKVPSGWALRIMTGWWWFYCLLMVVSYRASLTAILAKPEPIVTIDTIYELVNSPVKCGGWGEPEKLFFTTSFDPDIHKIGLKFETLTDVDLAIDRIAAGTFTYYENIYLLQNAAMRHLSRRNGTDQAKSRGETSKHNLHIMSDCIISMPISIGLEKNSPLKPRIDEFVQRVVEAGLIHKWLDDVMDEVRRKNLISSTEQVKALMDMRKFSGALVALAAGYVICILALIMENLYWHLVVRKHPLFDKYSMAHFYFCNK